MLISCIAIDDDPHSLENLIDYMNKVPNLELVQTFTEPLKALEEISTSNPVDIIFMDVEMPTISGIELASLLRQKTKHLIITTAHTKYAIDAFKVDADAYLLKPYSIFNFAKTINNLYPVGKKNPNPFSIFENHFFYIPTQNEDEALVKIELKELIAVEDLTLDLQFITIEKCYLIAKINFTKMIKMLTKHPSFIQISPSTIISKQHIKSVLGDQVLLSGEISYPIAITHKESFSNFIKNSVQQDETESGFDE